MVVYSKIPLHDAMKLNFENNQVTSFVITKPQPLRILCIYRSPSHHDESSFALFLNELDSHMTHDLPVVIMGEFNVDQKNQ